jgi:hypothetical protein
VADLEGLGRVPGVKYDELTGKVKDPRLDNVSADPNNDLFIRLIFPKKSPGERQYELDYEVHIPGGRKEVRPDEHLPVVFAIDSPTADKPYNGMPRDNLLNKASDDFGFIGVYPVPQARVRGIGITLTMRDWVSDGLGSVSYDRNDSNHDDAVGLHAVIQDVIQRFHPEPGFHLAAFSGGVPMALKLDSKEPAGTFVDNFLVNGTTFPTIADPPPGIRVMIVSGGANEMLPQDQQSAMHPRGWNMFAPSWWKKTVMRQFENTAITDQSEAPRILSAFLRSNEEQAGPPQYYDRGTYTRSVYPVGKGTVVRDWVAGAGNYWYGRDVGDGHETEATGFNGPMPKPGTYDATGQMVAFFGFKNQNGK